MAKRCDVAIGRKYKIGNKYISKDLYEYEIISGLEANKITIKFLDGEIKKIFTKSIRKNTVLKNKIPFKYCVGTRHKSTKGGYFTIIKIIGQKFTVKFDTGSELVACQSSVVNGKIQNPDVLKHKIGSKYITNSGDTVEIVRMLQNPRVIVRFEDGCEVETSISNLAKGQVGNPNKKGVFGFGCFGKNNYRESETKSYVTWYSMIRRCKSDLVKKSHPKYSNTNVCAEWCKYENFKVWFDNNFPSKIHDVKFHLDKDLLQQGLENKVYSPSTCIFLPKDINTFLSNKQITNTSGFIGVNFDKKSKKWRAQIKSRILNTKKHLGLFQTPEDASIAYQEARKLEAEDAKKYLRSLNYLSENIIQLIK